MPGGSSKWSTLRAADSVADLLQGKGDGRPYVVIGRFGATQATGVVFVLTHKLVQPRKKDGLFSIGRANLVIVGVSVRGLSQAERKPSVSHPHIQ